MRGTSKASSVGVFKEATACTAERAGVHEHLSRMTSLPPSRPKRMYLSWQSSTSVASCARFLTSCPLNVWHRACMRQTSLRHPSLIAMRTQLCTFHDAYYQLKVLVGAFGKPLQHLESIHPWIQCLYIRALRGVHFERKTGGRTVWNL